MNATGILYLIYWVYCIAAATVIMLVSHYFVHKLQELNYELKPFTAWIKERFFQDWFMLLLSGVIGLMLKICNIFFIAKFPILSYICFYGADALFLYLLYSFYASYKKAEHAQKLVVKGPAFRIFIFVWIVAFLCEANMMRETVYYISVSWLTYLAPYFIGYLPGMLLPLLVIAAFCVTSPRLAFGQKRAEASFYTENADGASEGSQEIDALPTEASMHENTNDENIKGENE